MWVAALLLTLLQDKDAKEEKLIAVVQVKKGVVREEAEFLADRVTVVQRSHKVRILEALDPWYRVELPDGKTTGYLHRSALKKPRPLNPGEELGRPVPEKKSTRSGPALGVPGERAEERIKRRRKLQKEYKTLDTVVIPRPSFKRDPVELQRRLKEFRKEGGLK